MICIVDGITSVSINGIEYESKDRVLEIPDELYPKIVHHPNIRAATTREIAALEKIAVERKKAAEKAAAEAGAKEAEKAAKRAAEEQAKREAEAKAAEAAAPMATEAEIKADEAVADPKAAKEAEPKGSGKNGGK